MSIRWIVNDKIESSIHKTKREALKEYNLLILCDYKYINSLEVIRHDKIKDNYKVIKSRIK